MTLISSTRAADDVADAIVYTTYCDDWQACVTLRGEVDLSNSDRLRAELDRHLDDGRQVLRVDAAGVTFIECRALGELVRADQRCRAATGALVLSRVSRPLQRLLQLTGLEYQLLVDTAADDR